MNELLALGILLLSAGVYTVFRLVQSDNCCICHTENTVNPCVCWKHKQQAKTYAKMNGMYVSQALGELYLIAKYK